MESPVRTRRTEGGVAVVEMARPERRNAMSTEMLRALLGALSSAASDGGARAVLVTGGPAVFSAGADVTEGIEGEAAVARMRLFCRLYDALASYPKPTVAAVAGPCVGGGAELAAACDLRVGSPTAAVRFPGAHFGIPAGIARLPLLVGLSHARDLLMTARTVDAAEAHAMGFLNRLVPADGLEEAAAGLALEMAANVGAMQQRRLLDEAAGLRARAGAENRALLRWQRGARRLME